jgi:G3E family GTPase
MVTVVDAYNFLRDYGSEDFLTERGESLGEDDTRTVVDLLVEQIEFCDVLLINKADLVEEAELIRLIAILHGLNPRARIHLSQFGKVALADILNTGLFDFDAAAAAPGWLREMRGEHTPETEEYGISSFVYHARRPFHPERYMALIHSEWDGVVRSKGYFWLASRMDFAGLWSQAGATCRHGAAGLWWSAVDKADWPQDADYLANIASKWDGDYGDRRQELVFIGMQMNQAEIRAKLDACLLTDHEMTQGEAVWRTYADPFPDWRAVTRDA